MKAKGSGCLQRGLGKKRVILHFGGGGVPQTQPCKIPDWSKRSRQRESGWRRRRKMVLIWTSHLELAKSVGVRLRDGELSQRAWRGRQPEEGKWRVKKLLTAARQGEEAWVLKEQLMWCSFEAGKKVWTVSSKRSTDVKSWHKFCLQQFGSFGLFIFFPVISFCIILLVMKLQRLIHSGLYCEEKLLSTEPLLYLLGSPGLLSWTWKWTYTFKPPHSPLQFNS